MIEYLIKYIQDHGYLCGIIPAHGMFPGSLVLHKYVGGTIYAVTWCIPKHDLRPELEKMLYYQASEKMALIDEAIVKQEQSI